MHANAAITFCGTSYYYFYCLAFVKSVARSCCGYSGMWACVCLSAWSVAWIRFQSVSLFITLWRSKVRAPRTSCVCKTENDYNGSDTNGKTISSGVHDLIMWKLIGAVHKRSAHTHTRLFALQSAHICIAYMCTRFI